MGNATSIKRRNTITKENIVNAHKELNKNPDKPVKHFSIFERIMDYPNLVHDRHVTRFSRLLVSCIRKGEIDPLSVEKV